MEEGRFSRASRVRPVGLGLSIGQLCAPFGARVARLRPLLGAVAFLAALAPAAPAQAPLPVKNLAEAETPPNPIEGLATALSHCKPNLPERDRWQIAGVVHRESQRYGYDPYFVLAMMEVESTCTPTARGTHGAVGLIQVRQATAQAMADEAGLGRVRPGDLTEPAINVRLGLRYLWKLERQFRDPYLAMVAYNMGPARVGQMPRWRARQATYVRKILRRYEAILERLEA
jgi:soluble lytic murein transglycosylase-like protein